MLMEIIMKIILSELDIDSPHKFQKTCFLKIIPTIPSLLIKFWTMYMYMYQLPEPNTCSYASD